MTFTIEVLAATTTPSAPSGTLPATGADLGRTLMLGLTALGAGATAVLFARRRRIAGTRR